MTPLAQRARHGLARRVAAVALAVGVAIAARSVAVRGLPVDYDELVYLPAGYWYAARMTPGRWVELPAEPANTEHPPLVKLLFALELRRSGAPEPDWSQVHAGAPWPEAARSAFLHARSVSAAAGVLQVALLAAVAPAAGLWLAVDTYHVKFTSEAYVDAVPGLLALLAVLLFERALRPAAGGPAPPAGPSGASPRAIPLLAAAALLGLATAGKYGYGLVLALTFAPFLLARPRPRPWLLAAGLAAAGVAFLIADPALWPDPIGRLRASVGFHFLYAEGRPVTSLDLPWWQPLVWLTRPAPATWHPGLFLVSFPDRLLLVAAALSIGAAWRRRPVWVAWAVVGLAFLLAWPTKWPQYTLMIRPALAGCAGLGLSALRDGLVRRWGGSPSAPRSP